MVKITDTCRSTIGLGISASEQDAPTWGPLLDIGITSSIGLANSVWLDAPQALDVAVGILARLPELEGYTPKLAAIIAATIPGRTARQAADMTSGPARPFAQAYAEHVAAAMTEIFG